MASKIDSSEQRLKKLRKSYDLKSIREKIDALAELQGISLKHIRNISCDPILFKSNVENPIGVAQIPIGLAGPMHVEGKNAKGDCFVPMATTEGVLVLTYDLGMRLLRDESPIYTEVRSKVVHITPMFLVENDNHTKIEAFLRKCFSKIKAIAEKDSKHTTLLRIEEKRVGKQYLLKFCYDTADAHGLNMINHATFEACKYIEQQLDVPFYHRSHFSGVKHHSLVNEEEGYGRNVYARAIIPKNALDFFEITASQIKDYTDRCMECGAAAGINSINVHASNAIAAIFLACGQDVADLSSAHVCRSHCELTNNKKDLIWECELKNILVGTVGGGTGLGTQKECLEIAGSYGAGKSDRFAEIIAATVLAGEFPTAAAVINRTYVDTHNRFGRNNPK